MWRSLVLVLVGCYGPSITTGAPCTESRECPRDLVCAATGTCERTDVDAGVDSPPLTGGCWGAWLDGTAQLETPAIITQVSSTFAEGNVSLANDDLAIYFSRPPIIGSNDIYAATRASPTGAFSMPVEVDELSTLSVDGRLTLSADGSFGVLASDRAGGAGGSDLWSTSREGGTFTTPSQKAVEDLATPANQFDPELSPDGLTLYYSQSTLPGQDLVVARRATVADKFAAPEVVAIAGAAAVFADPTISPDGRVIVFASGASSNDLDLYVATRTSVKATFGAAKRLAINSPQIDADPELAQDGCTLLFSSNRAGSQSRDVWMSTVR
jgi:Tol biopolymer transport system component